MDCYEYIQLSINIIYDKMIEQYDIQDMEKYGYVYAKIRKGVYGLPQASKIARNFRTETLPPHGY